VAGPLEMFYWANQSDHKKPNEDLTTVLVSADGKPVTSINRVRFEAQASFADVPGLDILWVPGGDPDLLAAIMKHPCSPYHKATTHWYFVACLQEFRSIEMDTHHERFVVSGNRRQPVDRGRHFLRAG
jgi:transcriptional regulator GlxA family with amidase domain